MALTNHHLFIHKYNHKRRDTVFRSLSASQLEAFEKDELVKISDFGGKENSKE